ncbi:MAG: hypothetical protein ACXVHJ_15595 [Solirubrobacteraceae bacterium]
MTTTEPGLRGFMSPFEVPAPDGCEGWEAMYPYYALFSEERRESEEARGWFRDGMHFPEPMFPFDFVTADSPYMCLGQANSRIFAVPPALGIDHRVLYGWVYMSANPVTDPEEIGRRAELFGQRAGFYFQNWDELYGRWRTKVQETIDELASLEVPDLPDIEDEAIVTEGRGIGSTHTLLVAYNRLLESIDRIWQYHFEFLNLGYAAYLVFYELCKQSFPDIADQTIAKMVSGIDVVLFRPDNELKRLAGRALELSVADDVATADGEASLTQALSTSAEGREWLTEWEAVKDPWFHYSIGNGFYHHHRSWSDDPAVPLGHLGNYIRRLQAGEDVSRPLDQVTAERDRITAEYRALLDDEAGTAFEQNLGLARTVFPYVESHNFYVEHWYHTLFWNKVREFGALLAPPPLPRGPRGHLLPAAQRDLRRARGPAPCVGGRVGGPRHPLLAADRGAPQADHGGHAEVHAATGARCGARCDHGADDDHAVGHHHRAGARLGSRRRPVGPDARRVCGVGRRRGRSRPCRSRRRAPR